MRKKRHFISSEGFFAVEKNTVIYPQRAILPIQSEPVFLNDWSPGIDSKE
jgi:hypothetical protein